MLAELMALSAMSAWSAPWVTVPKSTSPLERAQWIWAKPPGEPPPTTENGFAGVIWFRQSFSILDLPPRAELEIAADNRARIWLNGREVGTSNDWSSPVRFDVSRVLLRGENKLIIEAENSKGSGTNPGGFIFALALSGGPDLEIVSDARLEASATSDFQSKIPVTALGPASVAPWRLGGENPRPPEFIRHFKLSKVPKVAPIRVIALPDYEVLVNRKPILKTVLNQPWTQFDKAVSYREFDLAPHLKKGENELCIRMANGFWYVAHPGGNRFAKFDAMPLVGKDQPFLLSVSGSADDVDLSTGASWSWRHGPITFSHVMAGEDWDARPLRYRESDVLAGQAPGAELREADGPTISVHERFRPKRWIERGPGHWSIDFGQNASSMLAFRVKGKAGQTLEFRPSEVMTPEGEVQQLNLWGREVVCRYTIGGSKPETHRWRAFYHGFQFLDVRGAVPKGRFNPRHLPEIEWIESQHIRADNPQSGSFECSSKLYNDIVKLIDWAMRSNMQHVMTDCPHREKLGWLECSYLLAPSFSYRYDCQKWMKKIAQDIRDAQQPDGLVPTVAPTYLQLPFTSDYAYTVEWGAAAVMLPWHLYQWYGDGEELRRAYPSMKAFVEHMASQAKDFIARPGLGDWYDYGHGHGPGPSRFTPQDLTATATFYMCVEVLERACAATQQGDRRRWTELKTSIAAAWRSKFYDPVAKMVKHNGSPQAGIAIALETGLIPEEDRSVVLQKLIDDLVARQYQQTPGDVGHVYFVRALARAGRSDILHKVYSRTGTGSYGGILAKGLTTLPETWDAITVGSNSLNHCMLGHAMEWFYGYVLGVRPVTNESSGWMKYAVQPNPGNLRWCRGSVRIPGGDVRVFWQVTGRKFVMDVDLPRSGAMLLAPSGSRDVVVDGVRDGGAGAPVYGEGRHRLEATLPD